MSDLFGFKDELQGRMHMMQGRRQVTTVGTDAKGRSALRSESRHTVFHCLIISGDGERRSMLAQAASDSGWEPILCGDSDSAWQAWQRLMLQLAIVDLKGEDASEFHSLLEDLSSSRDLLVVICGNEGCTEEEIWARQIGAWLYLPGVEEPTSVSLLCGEARQMVERLHTSASRERSITKS